VAVERWLAMVVAASNSGQRWHGPKIRPTIGQTMRKNKATYEPNNKANLPVNGPKMSGKCLSNNSRHVNDSSQA
jgi:hypothetical protein